MSTESIEQEVQPGEETAIPGSPFTVYHGGDEERWVTVEDGVLHLPHGNGWIVSLTGTAKGN